MRPILLCLTALVALFSTSCDLLKPKDPATSAYDPYGQQTSPYGQVPASNPYSQVPATNPYSQVPATNPYQTQPAANPYGSYEPAQTTPTPPQQSYNSTPSYSGGAASSGRSVTVKSGDTLTAIARRNGTSVAALKSSNGLTSDMIKIGQRLNLP